MNLSFIYKDQLPVSLSLGKPACHWHVQNNIFISCVTDATALIRDPSKIDSQLLIKEQTRRLIFKHKSPRGDVLIKAFPLNSIRKRLQNKKYAPSEAINLFMAQQRGIPVPELIGYGCQTEWLIVKWNAICQEFIDAPSLENLLDGESNPKERYKLLRRAFPSFKSLYCAGCNHIDFKPGSILTREDGEDVIIDWQYARFLAKPSKQILAAQAGYFAWDVSVRNRWIKPVEMDTWYQELLDYLNINDTTEMQSIFSKTSGLRHSIMDRLTGKAGLS